VLTAAELHERAVSEINAGRFAAARSLLTRALDRASADEELGSIEASLAYLEAETGNRAEAMRVCEHALARPELTDETRGSIHSQRATLLMLVGHAQDALDELDVAISMLGGSPKFLGRAHLNRGNLHLQRNDITNAERDFELAVDLLTEVGLEFEAAMSEHNLGYTRLLTGDLVGALRDMDRARTVLAPLSPISQATGDQDRAEVLMAAGLRTEGRAALKATARAYGARRLRRRQAEAELTLARASLDDDPSLALSVAKQAARRFHATEADAMGARAEAVALAAEVELGRKSPRLVSDGQRLAAELESQGLTWPATAMRLHSARVQIRRGQADHAGRVLLGVRTGSSAPLEVRLLADDVRAELATARGRRSVALGHLRRGLGDLHEWQSSFGSLDLQTNVVGRGTRLGVRGLALAVDSRRPEVLFEWSERGRMVASRIQPVRAPQDPSLVADLAELRELAQARRAGQPTSAQREAGLRQRVRERAWQHRGSGQVADPVSMAGLQAVLGPGRALVAYVTTANRVVALVVTDTSADQFDLGERARLDQQLDGLLPDLDMAASELPDPLAAVVRRELAQRLGALADLLVAPLTGAVSDREVVLTPSGALAAVPWTLLRGYAGRPVTVAESATSWLGRQERPLRFESAGLVAGPRVERAEDEVLSAAKEWDRVEVVTGDAATAKTVSRLAAKVDVLHVAAHGRHSAENPMFSGLELADGHWYGYDIDQLRAVPDVVVLSACELGASAVRWGEELIGMTSTWLHAGARRVVASAAAINDHAARDALVRVHERLAAGTEPAAALADAVPPFTPEAPPVPLVCFG
jgi:tetratricopeptide (TPR) repeat protein